MKLLMALLPIITGIAAECTYDASPQIATIGEKMVITCNLMMCFEDSFMWFRVNGTNRIPIDNEGSKKLVVSMNVTSAAEVGGQEYECYCSGDLDNCKKYNITVKPKVSLSFIPEVVRSGSNVSVICRAESFPPANSENYQMKHPMNKNITHQVLSDGSGVVHKIQAANKEEDKGVYDCIVTVPLSHYADSIQGEIYGNLTVYDPPTIIGVRNFTVISLNPPSAVVECVINNTELDVYVNWTINNGKQIEVEHITSHNDDSFYLVLFNATPGKYTCHLFSTYSLEEPEDTATASVINGLGSSCDSNMVKSAKENVTIEVLSTVISILIIIIIISIFLFVVKKYKRYKTFKANWEQQTVRSNDRYGQLNTLKTIDSAAEAGPLQRDVNIDQATVTHLVNPNRRAENKLFDECSENGEDQLIGKESLEGTSTPLAQKEMVPNTQTSHDIHTPPQPKNEDDKNGDNVFGSPVSPGHRETQGKQSLPRDRRPRSASKGWSGANSLEPLEESETESNTELATATLPQPRRPGSASKPGKQRRLPRSTSSASLDPTEVESLLSDSEDADEEAKTKCLPSSSKN